VETLRDLWEVQRLAPPPPTGSEGEKSWVREDRAVSYEKL